MVSRLAMVMMAATTVGVSGCGAASALNSGSPKACSEAAVHDAIRDLTVPSWDDPEKSSGDLKRLVIAADSVLPKVTLDYSDTTLDGFDRETHTATCSAVVQATLGDLKTDASRWTYVVQPSAEGGKIVVTSNDNSLPSSIHQIVMSAAKTKAGPPW